MLEIADDVETEEQIDNFKGEALVHRFSKCPSFEDLECQVDGGKEPADTMLICDLCDQGYRCDCIGLPATESPNGKWVCDAVRRGAKRL